MEIILSILILILIFFYLIIHKHLSNFYEMDKIFRTNDIPFKDAFLIWANLFVIIYLVNFIWMFGFLFGIILFFLAFFQVLFLSFLWIFLYPFLLIKKEVKPPTTSYAIFKLIIPLTLILTIINFFISDYSEFLFYLQDNFNFKSIIYVIIGILFLSIIRLFFHKKINK